MAFFNGSTSDRQYRRAFIANDQGQVDSPLTLRTAGEVAPVGDTKFSEALPPRGYTRRLDYSWDQHGGPPFYLAGEVAPMGKAVYELPPQAYVRPRLRDYTWESSGPPLYLNGEVAPVGVQVPDLLPPRAPARLRDYSWKSSSPPLYTAGEVAPVGVQSYELPPRGRPRGADLSTPYNNTIWLDLSQQVALPTGQSTGLTDNLPPRSPSRARDYTWRASSPPYYLAGEVAPVGAQSFELPPKSRPRGSDLSTPYNLTVWLQFAADQVPQFLKVTDLPPRAASRSRDYTFLHNADVQLFGQDAMVTGDQVGMDLPPRGYARAASLYDPLQNLTIIPDFIQNQGNVTGRSTADSALPPRGAPRSKDYTFLHPTDQQLIGQDAMVTGKSTQATELPPRGPARSRDYTWLQSMPLHVYQQLPVGDSTLATEGPPKGPKRLKDYTYLDSTVRLIGLDTMYGAPGQVPTYDWPNPIPYKRPLNYRMPWNSQPLFAGKPFEPGTVLAGSSITDTVLAGTSATGSVLAGTSQSEV